MPSNNLKSSKQANLLITNKTLKIDNPYVVYQINNIASMDKRYKKPDYSIIFSTIIFCIFIALFTSSLIVNVLRIFFIPYSISGLVALINIFFWIRLMIKTILYILRKKGSFSVAIFTADGKSVTIPGESEQYIDDIMSKIYEVMQNEDIVVNHHLKVNGDVIVQNGNFDTGVNKGIIN